MGAAVTLVGPSTLVPHWFTDLGVTVSHDLQVGLGRWKIVMLLRIQPERQSSSHYPSIGDYTSMFGLNKTRAAWLSPKAIIMHPGPLNRGVEIDSDLADGPRSVILEQVTNGIAVHMAVLYLCADGRPERSERGHRTESLPMPALWISEARVIDPSRPVGMGQGIFSLGTVVS